MHGMTRHVSIYIYKCMYGSCPEKLRYILSMSRFAYSFSFDTSRSSASQPQPALILAALALILAALASHSVDMEFLEALRDGRLNSESLATCVCVCVYVCVCE
jgi:hypothetical protein